MLRPQTIQIFLPDGNPQGLRQAEITTRTVLVFDVPRSSLPEFLDLDQAHQVGLYFLFDDADGLDERSRCYIGETDDVGQRLKNHDKGKDFWNRALAAVSLTNSWTKAHVRYMEAKAVHAAKDNGRYGVTNGNDGFTTAYTPKPMQADCDEFFDTISTLTATLGFPVLRPLKSRQQTSPVNVLHMRGLEATTSGAYSSEGLTVFAGTQLVPHNSNWRDYPHIDAQRGALLRDGVLGADDSGTVVFAQDYLFKSPSGAACVIQGRSSNGWKSWRDSENRPLNEIERRDADEQEA